MKDDETRFSDRYLHNCHKCSSRRLTYCTILYCADDRTVCPNSLPNVCQGLSRSRTFLTSRLLESRLRPDLTDVSTWGSRYRTRLLVISICGYLQFDMDLRVLFSVSLYVSTYFSPTSNIQHVLRYVSNFHSQLLHVDLSEYKNAQASSTSENKRI